MKKVLTIHISGLLFNMEEDAFAVMRESLFRQGKQGDKVTEALLAEKFGDLLTPVKQVITLSDVQLVLPQLGFKVSYESAYGYSEPARPEVRRIYRKKTNKVIGGVCEGLGEYWNMDPLVLRILFIVLVVGYGAGLLFYLLLWILLPVKK